jgi:hypothetical protein
MIEQDIARLWQRAANRAAMYDAAAARQALRELGLDPHSPPPEVEVKAAPDSGTPDQVSLRESCASRGDEAGVGGDEGGVGGDGGKAPSASIVAPAKARARKRPGAARKNSRPLDPCVRGDDEDLQAEAPEEVASPTRAPRHNEWTPDRMGKFLRELATCQNVSQAARSVGMGRQSAYKLRGRMAGTPFDTAWQAALEAGVQQLTDALMDRALNGEEVPVFYHGEQVGTRRKYDNRLAAWLFENRGLLGRDPRFRATPAGDWESLVAQVESDPAGRRRGR